MFESWCGTTNDKNTYRPKKILVMWKIIHLEWKEYLAYSIICCYIQYHEPCGYEMLEFTIGCLGVYVLRYYCKLEIDYWNYYNQHQTMLFGQPTFAMKWMEDRLNHVSCKVANALEQWKATITQCQKLSQLTDFGAKAMETIQWKTCYDYTQP